MTEGELTDWRLRQLEEDRKLQIKTNQDLVSAVNSLNTSFVTFKTTTVTWGKVALLIHPVFVGIIVAVAVRLIA